MTKEERKYLRAAFHHFVSKQVYGTAPDYIDLIKVKNNMEILMQFVYLVLTLQGDEDGDSKESLENLIITNNIEFIE